MRLHFLKVRIFDYLMFPIDQYKNGGLSQSLELLFSSDPTLYLSAAGSLDALTRRKSIQLNKFQAAEQRLNATTLTVEDKPILTATGIWKIMGTE